MVEDVTVVVNEEPRTIGHITETVDGEKRFVKRVSKEHFVRKYQGFGIHHEVFKQRILKEVDEIRVIYEREDGGEDMFIAKTPTWQRHGVVDRLGDFEEQIFLAKGDFDKRVIDGEVK